MPDEGTGLPWALLGEKTVVQQLSPRLKPSILEGRWMGYKMLVWVWTTGGFKGRRNTPPFREVHQAKEEVKKEKKRKKLNSFKKSQKLTKFARSLLKSEEYISSNDS